MMTTELRKASQIRPQEGIIVYVDVYIHPPFRRAIVQIRCAV